jgi:hypothetical protein
MGGTFLATDLAGIWFKNAYRAGMIGVGARALREWVKHLRMDQLWICPIDNLLYLRQMAGPIRRYICS